MNYGWTVCVTRVFIVYFRSQCVYLKFVTSNKCVLQKSLISCVGQFMIEHCFSSHFLIRGVFKFSENNSCHK